MKNLSLASQLLRSIGLVLALPFGLTAAEVNATVSTPAPVVPPPQVSLSASASAPAKLPYAATEVIKLTRAQVSEDVVISYVQNSSSTASLSTDDIVRLKNEGVSDRVIGAMMDKQSKALEKLPSTPAPAPVYAEAANAGVPEAAPQQPAVAPLTPSSSSTYVIPYPAATAAYYGYYSPYYYSPYYYRPYGYYGGYYGGPVFSFRFGYGGGYGHGGYHGGYHGGHGGIHAHGHR